MRSDSFSIKADPSLPTEAYTGGNIRDRSLRDIVENAPELNFNHHLGTPQATEHMWGFCKTCEHAEICRGGCSWTAHVFFDRRGNNIYCHHRALVQAENGIRERFYQETPASGLPFDNGKFAIVEESFDAALPDNDRLKFTKDKIVWPDRWPEDKDYMRGNLYDKRITKLTAPESVASVT